jgi:hypothetical protein
MVFDFIKAITQAEKRRNRRFVFSASLVAFLNERLDAELRQTLGEKEREEVGGSSGAPANLPIPENI